MTSRRVGLAMAGIVMFAGCTDRPESPTAPSAARSSAAEKTWSVAFKGKGLPANVDKLVADAGGTIVTRIPQIGAIAATSANPNFGTAIKDKAGVLAADESQEIRLIVPPHDGPGTTSADNNGGNFSPAGPDPQPGPEPLYSQQWDKMRMNVSATGSYAIQQGRRDVFVAVLDTGTDLFHPDIVGAGQLDVARSRSFVGVLPRPDPMPDDPAEPDIQDRNGHGTWCMSAVGAPINGIGISGVAPNVSFVALKVLNATGRGLFIWLADALVYAGENHFDVASMSLGGYIPKCGNKHVDADGDPICDHADYIITHRAIQFARSNGVLPVAAMGNENFDLSDGSFFRYFIEAPGEMAGVVGVSATGYYNQKAHYSNYGSPVDLSAPGGATRNYTGVPGSGAPPAPYLGLGRVLGAWSSTATSVPPDMTEQCTGPLGTPPCFLYVWIQGTSMATPHVAGVAGLIISQYGTPDLSPTRIEQILQISANNQPCPSPNTVIAGPGFVFPTSTCQGGVGENGFFGKGIVDAVKAVTLH
jgi:lantibiotic leader peptide-processing serine protease